MARTLKRRRIREDEEDEEDIQGGDEDLDAEEEEEDEEEEEEEEEEVEEVDDGWEDDDEEPHGVVNLLDDEAEDEDEGEEEGSFAQESTDSNASFVETVPIARNSTKPERRTQRIFANAIIEQALSSGWENEELARFMAVVLTELDLISRPEKAVKFLSTLSVGGHPVILQRLMDETRLSLSQEQLVELVWNQATSAEGGGGDATERFLALIEDACEQHLFSPRDLDLVDRLVALGQDTANFSVSTMKRLCRVLCSHSGTKRSCGKILQAFTSTLPAANACSFVADVVQHDYFMDLRGSTNDLYSQLPEIRADLQQYLADHTNEHGELVDSDEDDEGNLRGFVVEDEDEGDGEEEGEGDYDEDDDEEGGEGGDETDEEGVFAG